MPKQEQTAMSSASRIFAKVAAAIARIHATFSPLLLLVSLCGRVVKQSGWPNKLSQIQPMTASKSIVGVVEGGERRGKTNRTHRLASKPIAMCYNVTIIDSKTI